MAFLFIICKSSGNPSNWDSPFFKTVPDGRTDGRTNEQTYPLIDLLAAGKKVVGNREREGGSQWGRQREPPPPWPREWAHQRGVPAPPTRSETGLEAAAPAPLGIPRAGSQLLGMREAEEITTLGQEEEMDNYEREDKL